MTFLSAPPESLPATLADAHALIRAQQARLATLQELVSIPDQNPNPVFRLQANGELLYANPAGRRLREELGLAVEQAMQEQVRHWMREALASNAAVQHDVSLQNRHFTVCVVPDAAVGATTLYLIEATARVQAEEQRAAQRTFTEQVLDSTPSLIYVRDLEGRFLLENRAMRVLREASRHEYLAAEPGSEQAQEVRRYSAGDAYVINTGQELESEDPFTLPSGEVRWFHSIKRPLHQPDGSLHVLGVSNDITELKRAQRAAEAAAEARANFLANMSHEIRTPLNGVLGLTAQLAKTPLFPHQQHLLELVRSSGRHLLGLVNDVLDLAKITSGKLELSLAPFDLCTSMGQAIEPLVLQARQKGISVEGTLLRESCPYPWVVGDAHRLNQILLNLVSNAVKFTPAGGHIHVGGYLLAETDADFEVEFRVRDSGVGIAPDKIERIFQPFTQEHADTARQFGGTGLGLSISRALVEQMGGLLTAESTPGQGSTFAFRLKLPRATAPAMVAAMPGSAERTALRGKRLLLVEDNDINRLVARMLLEDWGIELDEAEDGPSGVALASAGHYDVILMDIQMPGMSGLEATAAVRALPDPARAGVPIMALTANAFEADAQQYLAAGMNACVAKPFEEDTLYQAIADLLATR